MGAAVLRFGGSIRAFRVHIYIYIGFCFWDTEIDKVWASEFCLGLGGWVGCTPCGSGDLEI